MIGERRALASFVAFSVLAGGNAVAVRFSNRELPPLWGAGLRFVFGAILLGIVMGVMRLRLPRPWDSAGAALYGLLGFGGAYALAYVALVRLHAGIGQTLLALVPLATLLLAVAWRQEHLRREGVIGGVVALTGVAVISGGSVDATLPLPSVLAALGSVLCIAQSAVLVRRLPPMHPVSMNTLGMAAGALLLVLLSAIVGEPHPLPTQAETWLALAYVVPIGSVVVFILYLMVLRQWAASRAAYGFVIIPFVTVALSAWLDDEPLRWSLIFGGPLVLVGVYLGALRTRSFAPTEAAPGYDERSAR